MKPQIYPWKVTIDPPQVPPGEDTRVTIELNQTTTDPLVLSIWTSPVGAFVDMPDTVTVPAGADEYSLDLVVAAGQSGAILFTAASNCGQACGACMVPGTTATLRLAA